MDRVMVNKLKVYSLSTGVIGTLGLILNHIYPHKHFAFNWFILSFMLCIQSYLIADIEKQNESIREHIMSFGNCDVLNNFNKKVMKSTESANYQWIRSMTVFLFIVALNYLGCFEYTATGIYGMLLGAVVFYAGLEYYYKFIMLMSFMKDWGKLYVIQEEATNFREVTSMLKKELRQLYCWFIILGLLYCSVYLVNVEYTALNRIQSISIAGTLCWIVIFYAAAVPMFGVFYKMYSKAI